MDALPEIDIRFDPNEEDIVDREIIRELTHGGTEESAAQCIKRDEATIRRRMGVILIRLLRQR